MRTLPSSGNKRPSATDPTRGYANADGPGGSTVNYGPHKGGFNFNGLSSPRWDDRDPSRDYTPAMLQQEAAARQPYIDRRNELLGGDQAYQQAKQSGDMRGMIAAMSLLKQQGQQDRFVAQGGTPETWANRYDENANWPVPRSPSGNYQYSPGQPGPTPPNVAQSAPSGGVRRGATPQANAPMSAGMPPSQNPMFEGYQGGGQGVVSGGNGQFGRAGGMPMGGAGDYVYRGNGGNPFASMGGGETGMMYPGGMALQGPSSLGMGGDMSMQGRGFPGGFVPPGFGQGGRQPINPGSYNPQPFNPYQPRQQPPQGGGSPWAGMQAGFAPFDPGNFSMPYDQFSGMGFW